MKHKEPKVHNAKPAAKHGAAKHAHSTAKTTDATSKVHHHGEATSYRYSSVVSADLNPPFSLKVRPPDWFPDGVDSDGSRRLRVFPEEVVGSKSSSLIPFGVYFDDDENKDTDPKQWLLGSKIGDASEGGLTTLIRALAVRARQYNASLYRLRRLHFIKKTPSNSANWPRRNPHGDPPDPLDPAKSDFQDIVLEAEQNWSDVNNNFTDFLETASQNLGVYNFRLQAADMVQVNGYIVSMRVVAVRTNTLEVGGSSSHVSLSSAFSSSSLNSGH
ncbi:MAG: hypothetical protein C5B50_28650 [Verrucomicrobia bacterium]|nr:MAG: hypothetical protein C5B50_28650 [Verrucomicrobiota bacterium]